MKHNIVNDLIMLQTDCMHKHVYYYYRGWVVPRIRVSQHIVLHVDSSSWNLMHTAFPTDSPRKTPAFPEVSKDLILYRFPHKVSLRMCQKQQQQKDRPESWQVSTAVSLWEHVSCWKQSSNWARRNGGNKWTLIINIAAEINSHAVSVGTSEVQRDEKVKASFWRADDCQAVFFSPEVQELKGFPCPSQWDFADNFKISWHAQHAFYCCLHSEMTYSVQTQ